MNNSFLLIVTFWIIHILSGHRPPESVVYNSCKDLERYRSLVFQNQLITAQLEVMDSSANLILPVLKSINPASRYVC